MNIFRITSLLKLISILLFMTSLIFSQLCFGTGEINAHRNEKLAKINSILATEDKGPRIIRGIPALLEDDEEREEFARARTYLVQEAARYAVWSRLALEHRNAALMQINNLRCGIAGDTKIYTSWTEQYDGVTEIMLLSPDDIRNLIDALRTDRTIKNLQFSNTPLNSMIEALLNLFTIRTDFTTIDLTNCNLTQEMLERILAVLQNNHVLTRINIDGNILGMAVAAPEAAAADAHAWEAPRPGPSLQERFNALINRNIEEQLLATARNPETTIESLRSIIAHHNGNPAILTAVAAHPNIDAELRAKITHLIDERVLSFIHDAEKTGRAFIDRLLVVPTTEVIQRIFAWLRTTHTIFRINFSGANINTDSTQAIAEMLRDNTTLTAINLTHNNIRIDGIRLLVITLVRENMTLISFEADHLLENFSPLVRSALARNQQLHSLYEKLKTKAHFSAAFGHHEGMDHLLSMIMDGTIEQFEDLTAEDLYIIADIRRLQDDLIRLLQDAELPLPSERFLPPHLRTIAEPGIAAAAVPILHEIEHHAAALGRTHQPIRGEPDDPIQEEKS